MIDNERKKHLLETMKGLNKSLGKSIVGFGEDSEDAETIPSGIDSLDSFIGGGWKAGSFSVIYGAEATGKSTLVLQSIANAQKMGKICCYIDLEHSFSKDRAVQFGINLEDLVLIEKCQTAEDALNIVRGFCQEKAVDLFAIDSVQSMSPLNQQQNKGKTRNLEEKEIAELARLMSKFFQVVSPDVFNAKASVILTGQIRVGGIGTFFTRATMTGGEALKHWASLRLFIRRGQGADAPIKKVKKQIETPDGIIKKTVNEVLGFDCVIKIEKTRSSKSAKEHSEIHLPFYYDSGFLPLKETSELSPESMDSIKKGLQDAKEGNVSEYIPSDEEVEEILNNPNSTVVETKMTKELSDALDAPVKKKRGRKPKNANPS